VQDRVAQIMSAGVAGKAGKILDSGTPEQQADAIIEFLRQHGFLGQAGMKLAELTWPMWRKPSPRA
jgi:hypothetical protein